MEKDTSSQVHDTLIKRLPFLYSPEYDDPVTRRMFRDAYLHDVIVGLLVNAEKKRGISSKSTDQGSYWTIEELYVACMDVWVGIMSSVLAGKEGMLYPNPHYVREKILTYTIGYFGHDSKFHFTNGHGYTHPTEDNIVPFNINDVHSVMNKLILEGNVGMVSNSAINRKCLDVELLEKSIKSIKEKWIELNPKKKLETSQDVINLFFKGKDNHGLPEQILYAGNTALKELGREQKIVTFAELLVHGDGVHNYFLHQPRKQPLDTSKYTLPENKEGVRTIIEPYPYGYPNAPAEDRKGTMLGTYVNGIAYMVEQMAPVFDAFPNLIVTDKDIPLQGYVALILDTPTAYHLPVGMDVLTLDDGSDSIMATIEAFLHINQAYEAYVEEELDKIDQRAK